MNTFSKVVFWITWPAIFIVVRNTNRTRVIIKYKDQILLVQGWIGNKKWQLPGGGVKKNEPIKLAAIREVKEETGLQLKESQLQNLGESKIFESGFSYQAHYFLVDLKDIQDFHGSHEIKLAKMFKIDSLKEEELTLDVIYGLTLIEP
ncbi:MAG: NUDIX hydrolase [bacterium]|jgi:ADP-ribose pyrophosphatase YjhB (NUDIX family)